MNRVALNVPGLVTVTFRLHEATCCLASRAVHVTLVVPTEKFEPLVGVQEVETGAFPPVAVAVP